MSKVLFCLDSESVKHPGLVGLGDEQLTTLGWMRVCCTAEEARAFAKSEVKLEEIWVASSNDMEAINLAAAIKHDSNEHSVLLVSPHPTGSTMSRAHMANIATILDEKAFARHYAKSKKRFSNGQTGIAHGTSIMVTSASGGAGKTAVAALAASISAQAGFRTLLIDANLQYGDAASCLKNAYAIDSEQILTDIDALSEISDEHILTVTKAPSRLEQAESLTCELPTLLDAASAIFDVVVVDANSIWDDAQISLIERCTKVLFLVDQRASSAHASKRALDLLIRCGIATGSMQFALNRCSKSAAYSPIDISCSLQGASVFELRDGGREVEELMGIGMADELIAERNPLAESVSTLLSGWLPTVDPASTKTSKTAKGQSGTLLGKLIRR